ncbi:MAG: hypothetical protein ACI87O_002745, partial [Planctomycetota bacterium]
PFLFSVVLVAPWRWATALKVNKVEGMLGPTAPDPVFDFAIALKTICAQFH